jgi:putative ABC transport system permease protein
MSDLGCSGAACCASLFFHQSPITSHHSLKTMFLRLVSDSFTRRPRRKLFTGAALALGMAVATAALSVSLDVGDRLAREFRSLGANLIVTPQADSLPLEIGGVDYRPVNSGAYLPESDLPKIKSVFWHNNIIAFAPLLEAKVTSWTPQFSPASAAFVKPSPTGDAVLIGTWSAHDVKLPDGGTFATGLSQTNPWWHIDGAWFKDGAAECIVGHAFAKKNSLTIGSPLYLSTESSDGLPLTVTGIFESGDENDGAVVASMPIVQSYLGKPGQYRKLYVSALTKPEDDFARRDLKTMSRDELERWSCTPYVSSIAYSIQQVLPGSDVRVIRRVAEGEGAILTRVRILLWLVTAASLLAAALAVGASSAASVIERRTEIGLMKALGAASAKVGFLLAAEQLLLAFVGGGVGYAIGILLARILGQTVFGVAPQPSLLVLAVVLVLAAVVTLLGSAIPLRRASRFEPAPILRGE